MIQLLLEFRCQKSNKRTHRSNEGIQTPSPLPTPYLDPPMKQCSDSFCLSVSLSTSFFYQSVYVFSLLPACLPLCLSVVCTLVSLSALLSVFLSAYSSFPFGGNRQSRVDQTLFVTFPNATAEVAISRRKLSPSFPGAATDRGFVPMDGYVMK